MLKRKRSEMFPFFYYINPICLMFLIITIFWSECRGKNLLCKPVLLKEWGKVGHWCLLKRKRSEIFPIFFLSYIYNPYRPVIFYQKYFWSEYHGRKSYTKNVLLKGSWVQIYIFPFPNPLKSPLLSSEVKPCVQQ